MYDDVNRVTEKIEASRVRSKEADVKFSLVEFEGKGQCLYVTLH